ncbi:MAG TPA: iron-sulfur cluster assembly protein, partial [Candidatus Eremiobacteraceae bacterium]|nr:iron-sulfur cluster assembly protein [Candidatus Eremiobacteraceae bacterium]
MFGKKQAVSEEQVLSALRTVQEPDLHRDLVTLNMIKDLKISDGTVNFTIMLTTPACPFKSKMQADARQAVLQIAGVKEANVTMNAVTADARAPLEALSKALRGWQVSGSYRKRRQKFNRDW